MTSNNLNVKEFYKDKIILITGCTGFIGKIILEKLIRTCSDFKTIYVMIRKRQGTTLDARMKKEIYDSYLFQHLFEKRPELVRLC